MRAAPRTLAEAASAAGLERAPTSAEAAAGQRFVPAVTTPSMAVDGELNARIVEAVAATYKDVGGAISPRDLGRVAAEIYNDVVAAGLETWDEKMVALRVAIGQLRRRLLTAPAPGEDKRLA
ncbi:MAG: hypothetical protein M0006_03505 [Magnetospirillum sp.]|nr:hypothetical protein [Magnetospirillum sp.]